MGLLRQMSRQLSGLYSCRMIYVHSQILRTVHETV